jgi:phospholipid transport system substrate-binding protein
MNRRAGLGAIAAVWLTAGIAIAAPPDDPAATSRFVQQAGSDLAAILSTDAPNDEKRQQLRAFLDRVADVDAVARFCLGRFWPEATPAQRQEFTRLFHDVLINSISGEGHQYQHGTATVTLAPAQPRPDGVHVPTTVVRQGEAPFRVTWVVSYDSGSPKIVDVIAEGISMRVTQRSDYASFLARNHGDIAALIEAIQRQLQNEQSQR